MIPEVIAHFWQSTLFVGAAWLITLVLRTNHAQLRYRVWFAASAKFLAPLSLLVRLGSLMPYRAATQALPTGWMVALQDIGQPAPLLSVSAQQTVVMNHDNLVGIALIVWACGFTAIAISWLLRWKRVHALRRSARIVTLPTNLQIPVPVMSTPDLVEPGVVGILRPVLLLPEGITERIEQTQLNAILIHELCHVRRKDNLTATIHMAVQAIFWFHPLTWWIGARLLDERERACDEKVLRQGCKPSLYAESILEICKLYLPSSLACVSGVTGSNLTRRIEAIMRNRRLTRLNPAKRLMLGIAVLAALVMPIVIGSLNTPAVQAQEVRPHFEVASLRPNPGCENAPMSGQLSPSPGRLEMPCVILWRLIQSAYGTFGDGVGINSQPLPIEGGPSWLRSEHYTLSAKSDGPVRTEMLAGPMLQVFLEERFHLRSHRESREVPVYAMTAQRGGLKVQPVAEGSCTPIDLTHPPAPTKPGEPRLRLCGAIRLGPIGNGEMMVELTGATMTQFSQRLSGLMDRAVVDKTGISGRFDFHLKFAPDRNMPGQRLPGQRGDETSNATADPGPSLTVALQEQIGLKLSSEKGSVSILVIDHVEKRSAN